MRNSAPDVAPPRLHAFTSSRSLIAAKFDPAACAAHPWPLQLTATILVFPGMAMKVRQLIVPHQLIKH